MNNNYKVINNQVCVAKTVTVQKKVYVPVQKGKVKFIYLPKFQAFDTPHSWISRNLQWLMDHHITNYYAAAMVAKNKKVWFIKA